MYVITIYKDQNEFDTIFEFCIKVNHTKMSTDNFFKTSLSFMQGGLTFVLYDITNFTLGRKCGMASMFRAGNAMNAEEKEES